MSRQIHLTDLKNAGGAVVGWSSARHSSCCSSSRSGCPIGDADALLVSADTHSEKDHVDKSAWRLLWVKKQVTR